MENPFKKISLVKQAGDWYKENPEDQYKDKQLLLYDKAAIELTKRKEFAKFLVEEIGERPGKILEIAAGSGLISEELRNAFDDVVFLDLSFQALRVLKDRVEKEKESEIVNADFYDLPFHDEVFDTIVCVGGYRYVDPEKKKEFWDEITRVLKKDGKMFFAQFKPHGSHMQGTPLHDAEETKHLSVHNVSEFRATTEIGPLSVPAGKYELVEYHNAT